MTRNIDELSQALDELNAGRKPQEPGEEISELLIVAALLKKADLPSRPPSHILEATEQRASEGLKAGRAGRRSAWLYSGVLGAAASLLIFFGINGLPGRQAPSQALLPQVMQQNTALAPTEPKAPPAATPDNKPSDLKAAPAPPASSKTAPGLAVPAAKPAAPSAAPPPSPSPPAAPQAPPQSSPIAFALTQGPLRLPDRNPDSTVVEEKTGTVRQVYDAGTPLELILTQRPLTQADGAALTQPKKYAAREAGKGAQSTATAINKVTVVVAGLEITLEGRKTTQELLDLAASLKP